MQMQWGVPPLKVTHVRYTFKLQVFYRVTEEFTFKFFLPLLHVVEVTRVLCPVLPDVLVLPPKPKYHP